MAQRETPGQVIHRDGVVHGPRFRARQLADGRVIITGTERGAVARFAAALGGHGFSAEAVLPRSLAPLRDLDHMHDVAAIVSVGELIDVDVAVAAALTDVALLPVPAELEPAVFAERFSHALVESHTALVVRLDGRPAQLALAECVAIAEEEDGMVDVTVVGESGSLAAREVRVANRDPLGLLAPICDGDGSPTTVTVRCSGDASERNVGRRSRILVSPRRGAGRLQVMSDGERLRGIARQLRIGPHRRLRVARLRP